MENNPKKMSLPRRLESGGRLRTLVLASVFWMFDLIRQAVGSVQPPHALSCSLPVRNLSLVLFIASAQSSAWVQTLL